MDRYFYQLHDNPINSDDVAVWSRIDNTSGYYIYDRKVSSVKEIAICHDIGFAQTIVGALNGGTFKANYEHRRA